jgi:hypothetical protein
MDILIVDELGKEISGAGMDPNVTGRGIAHDGPDSLLPDITRIVVRDLSEKTHGNAVGVGMADFVTQRLVDKLDRHSTYINCLTSGGPGGASIPMTSPTDREAVEWAFLTIGPVESTEARVVHIQNTLHLEHFYASEALRPEVEADPQLEILEKWAPMAFDESGVLLPGRVS